MTEPSSTASVTWQSAGTRNTSPSVTSAPTAKVVVPTMMGWAQVRLTTLATDGVNCSKWRGSSSSVPTLMRFTLVIWLSCSTSWRSASGCTKRLQMLLKVSPGLMR